MVAQGHSRKRTERPPPGILRNQRPVILRKPFHLGWPAIWRRSRTGVGGDERGGQPVRDPPTLAEICRSPVEYARADGSIPLLRRDAVFAGHAALQRGIPGLDAAMKQNPPMKSAWGAILWMSPTLLLMLLADPRAAFALGQKQYVATIPSQGSFPIVQEKTAATIYVDANDHAGVARTAGDLGADVNRVTSFSPRL